MLNRFGILDMIPGEKHFSIRTFEFKLSGLTDHVKGFLLILNGRNGHANAVITLFGHRRFGNAEGVDTIGNSSNSAVHFIAV